MMTMCTMDLLLKYPNIQRLVWPSENKYTYNGPFQFLPQICASLTPTCCNTTPENLKLQSLLNILPMAALNGSKLGSRTNHLLNA
jgi:hypothetical protein